MKQKKILITGAGDGIGLACVERFLDEEWTVYAHYNKAQTKLKKLQKKVGVTNLIMKQSDFSRTGSLKAFVSWMSQLDLDALVNNAAVYDFSKRGSDRIKALQSVALVNMIAPLLIAEASLKRMTKKRKGCIVNVGSIAAKYGSGLNHVFYGMSKAGLESLTKSLAREGASSRVLINTVRPGVTDTKFHKKSGKNLSKRRKMIPLKRLAKPAEISEAIFFLCTTNSFMTSEMITVAGGE